MKRLYGGYRKRLDDTVIVVSFLLLFDGIFKELRELPAYANQPIYLCVEDSFLLKLLPWLGSVNKFNKRSSGIPAFTSIKEAYVVYC